MDGSAVRAVEMAGMSGWKVGAGRRGMEVSAMSLECAETVYIPYVGGQTRILSREGAQKQRRRQSIASSLPTPRKRFSGVRGGDGVVLVVVVVIGGGEALRRSQRRDFRAPW